MVAAVELKAMPHHEKVAQGAEVEELVALGLQHPLAKHQGVVDFPIFKAQLKEIL